MNVDRVAAAEIRLAPYFVHQLLAGHHLASGGKNRTQQIVFGLGQLDARALTRHGHAIGIERNIFERQQPGRLCRFRMLHRQQLDFGDDFVDRARPDDRLFPRVCIRRAAYESQYGRGAVGRPSGRNRSRSFHGAVDYDDVALNHRKQRIVGMMQKQDVVASSGKLGDKRSQRCRARADDQNSICNLAVIAFGGQTVVGRQTVGQHGFFNQWADLFALLHDWHTPLNTYCSFVIV